MPGTKRRSRRSRRRRRGGVNSLEQVEHGADKVTGTVLSKPKEFAGAIGGEVGGLGGDLERPFARAGRKAKELGGNFVGFLKKLKFWGGRRRTRRGRRHHHTRRCRHRRRHRHTKRCRRRRSRRRRRRRRR